MPTPVLDAMAKKYNVPLKKVEYYWDSGKKQAEEQGLQGDAVYKYAMAIVKRRLGVKEEKANDIVHEKVKEVLNDFIKIKDRILSDNSAKQAITINLAEEIAQWISILSPKAILDELDNLKPNLQKDDLKVFAFFQECVSTKFSKKYKDNSFYLVFKYNYLPDVIESELRSKEDAPGLFVRYLLINNKAAFLIKDTKIKIPEYIFDTFATYVLQFTESAVDLLISKRLPATENIVNRVLTNYLSNRFNYPPESIYTIFDFYKRFNVKPNKEFFNTLTSLLSKERSPVDIPDSFQIHVLSLNPSLARKISNLSDASRKFVETKIEWKEKKYLPKHLDADQLAVIRYMDLMKIDEVSVKDLKSKFSFTPTIKDLINLKSGKNLSRQDVMDFIPAGEKITLTELLKNSVMQKSARWTGMQQIFNSSGNKQNLVVVMACNIDDLLKVLDINSNFQKESVLEGINRYMTLSNHPRSPTRLLVLGWVRYTVFGKIVWIDEVQSDLYKVLGDLSKDLKGLTEYIAKEFIRTMRSKGFGKFDYPTMQIKTSLYGANPPASMYEDLPRKLRFKKKEGSTLPDSITEKEDRLTKYQVWELAGIKVLEKDNGDE